MEIQGRIKTIFATETVGQYGCRLENRTHSNHECSATTAASRAGTTATSCTSNACTSSTESATAGTTTAAV